MMVDALRTGDPDAVADALALIKSSEVHEVEGPPKPLDEDGEDGSGEVHPQDQCWQDSDGVWMTDLPPPTDFSGYEKEAYGDDGYERECSPEEVELFEAFLAIGTDEDRADDEAFRDAWLARLREQLPSGEKIAAG